MYPIYRCEVPGCTNEAMRHFVVCSSCRAKNEEAEKAWSAPPGPLFAWQPITTVPKDGTRVIVTKIINGKIGFITEGKWMGRSLVHSVALDYATHWMPVPDVPR